jgi:hypothetical protein
VASNQGAANILGEMIESKAAVVDDDGSVILQQQNSDQQ